LRPNQHEANLNNAFNVAEESLGIAKLLDAEGIIAFYSHFSIFLSNLHQIRLFLNIEFIVPHALHCY